MPRSPRARRRAGFASSISKARPTRPTMLVDVEAVAAARDAAFGERASGRRSPSTTPSSARCGPSRWRRARTSRVYSLTKYVGGHSDLVAGGARRRQGADQSGSHDAQHDRHDLRPEHRLDAAAQPRNARAAHEPAGENAEKVCDFLREPPEGREDRLSRLPRGGLAPGRHLPPPLHRRRLDLLALSEGRREGGVRLPRRAADRAISRSASAAPKRSPAPRRR